MGQCEKYVHREVANTKAYRLRTLRLVDPNQTWRFCLIDIAKKVPKCTKYEEKALSYNTVIFLVCSQYFKFSFSYMN